MKNNNKDKVYIFETLDEKIIKPLTDALKDLEKNGKQFAESFDSSDEFVKVYKNFNEDKSENAEKIKKAAHVIEATVMEEIENVSEMSKKIIDKVTEIVSELNSLKEDD